MNELYGTYPIIVGDEKIGELKVFKDGAMTTFSARCKNTGGMLRLSVYGDREGYLGVMIPLKEDYVLKKSIGKAGLSSFPEKIIFAGPSGQQVNAASKEKAG